ncbi:MAG TPA: histidine kinase dimerization/phospho-acceptor domain-containing protein [Nitrospiraceae bacterium]|nr:histidine kinase dimerization/phospho-acceptor domain-containing protein [Nitrospiraceae bacterium]
MTNDKTTDNRRILVIDDNVSIHEDFRKILVPPKSSDSLDLARVALFGETPSLPPQEHYELESAHQGKEGVDLVQSAQREGRPYAMAFVDMRMPPGWDGLETVEHLWQVAPDLEIVICTAYADHPWEDVSRRIGNTDKLLILLKPFNSIEVVQLANSLTKKWNLTNAFNLQIECLASCVSQRTDQLHEANDRLRENIARTIAETAKDQPQDDAAAAFLQKEEFLAIMSHEILTHINELVGEVNLLSDSPLSPGQREHATTIQRCAQDLLALLNDMHGFMTSRRQETQAGGRQ